MNWRTLKKKHPEIWNNVYEGMIFDLCECMPGSDIEQYKEGNKDCRIIRIAHNAAFFACDVVHKI